MHSIHIFKFPVFVLVPFFCISCIYLFISFALLSYIFSYSFASDIYLILFLFLYLCRYLFICGLHYAASRSNRIESKCRMIRMISSEWFGNGEYWNIRGLFWALYTMTWRDWWKPRKIRVREPACNPRPSEARELPFVIFLFLREMTVFHFLFICLRRLFPFVVSVPSPPSTVSKEQSLSLIQSALYVTTA
jgi:hypothetical protein